MKIQTMLGYDVALTTHSVEAMLKRSVSLRELEEVLTSPEQTYQGGGYMPGDRRVTLQKRDLAVVVSAETRRLITVLYRAGERWRSEDGRPSGRVLSKNQRRRLEALLRTLDN